MREVRKIVYPLLIDKPLIIIMDINSLSFVIGEVVAITKMVGS